MPPKKPKLSAAAPVPASAPRMTVGNYRRHNRTAAAARKRAALLLARNLAANVTIYAPAPLPQSPPSPPPPPSPDNSLHPLPAPGEVNATIIDDEVALQIFGELGIKSNDYFLNSGKVLAWALQPDDPAFINIHDYVGRGQVHGFGIKILSILRIIPKADSLQSSTPLDFSDDPATQGQLRMMLWHGTKRCHLRAILENGLKLPASHGQMFGSGIYFADRVSKSCQYCDNAYVIGGQAFLFLCDVLLGNMYKAYEAMAHLTGPPTPVDPEESVPFTSVKGCGTEVPDYQWDQFIDGSIWPLGPTIQNQDVLREGRPAALKFNEYIVYDATRVQPKYLVKVEFTQFPVHEQLY